MKLRIQDNSIRIRLKETEVLELAEIGRVESRIVFGPKESLVYAVESVASDEIRLMRGPALITVQLPKGDVEDWAENDVVGFEAVAENGEGGLRILVEKDLPCEHPAK